VLSDYRTSRAANDARRMKGDALFWSGSFDSAATLYKDYLSHAPSQSPVRLAVQQSLAFALESKRDFTGAAAMFEQLASTAPDRTSAADMYLCAGRAYSEAGQKDKARALYVKVTEEYKDAASFERDAEVALGELDTAVARDTPHPAAIIPQKPAAAPPSGMQPNVQVINNTGSAGGKVTVTAGGVKATAGATKKGK